MAYGLYTLKEIIWELYNISINDKIDGYDDYFGAYVTGVDLLGDSNRVRIWLEAPSSQGGAAERLNGGDDRLAALNAGLAEIFGCEEVELVYEKYGPDSNAITDGVSSGATKNGGAKPGVTAKNVGANSGAAKNKGARAGGDRPGGTAKTKKTNGNGARKTSREKIKAGDFLRSMKGIDFEDGAYFTENPKIICGVKIASAPAPISSLAGDGLERATVWGEIISMNFKPVRNGETEILECGITDGAGSIAVKTFIRSDCVGFVKPRLSVGDCILIYGEIQYDAYMKESALFAIDINKYERKPRLDEAFEKRVELHLHTQMSAMDAVTPVEKLVMRAAQFGHPAVAITDHGVVQSFPDACDAGKKFGIKIIYGVEGYLDAGGNGNIAKRAATRAAVSAAAPSLRAAAPAAKQPIPAQSAAVSAAEPGASEGAPPDAGPDETSPYHIILLVKTKTGLKNLYKLISKSHVEHFYKRPRMPRAEIEALREGLIVGGACEAGELFTAIRNGAAHDELVRIARFYDYLEIQPIGNNMFLLRDGAVSSVDELKEINKKIVSLGDELGKPVAATCDVHFVDREDEVFRRILMAGQNYADADAQPPLYLRTTSEMLGEFEYLGAEKAYEVVVTNTNLINGMIEDGVKPIPDGTFNPDMPGAGEELRAITEASARRIYGDELPPGVRLRLDQELETIISKNFSVLYMIAHKLIKKSNEDGYFVGSRGSVGSSLAANLAGITEVNPLPPHYLCPDCKRFEYSQDKSVTSGYDLPPKKCPACGAEMSQDGQDIMFEMFIGAKGQEKAPDIDLNFSGEYQQTAHKYTEELFGASNVFKAGTINTIADKTAYGFVKKYLDVKGLAPGRIEEDRLAKGCTGVKRTTGQHPGGIVVIPHDREIYDFTPVQRPADAVGADIITTHFDFNSLHNTILKLDLLGHDDPSIVKMLEDLTGVKSSDIKMNDPKIQSLFTSTSALGVAPDEIGSPVGTIGLPEFGTRFLRQMLVDTKPKNFADLLQISGLSHGRNVWLNNAQDLIRGGVCTISDVIGTREGLVLTLMNYGLDQFTAFEIMESVRKKNSTVSKEAEQLMREKGVPEWYIDSCKKVEYLFPKAHATAYVQMAYHQAWYKINRPEAFYAAYFSIRADEFDAELMTRGAEKAKLQLDRLNRLGREISPREQKILTILEVVVEMHARGIKFLPVDLYCSDAARFTIEGGAIRPPLISLSGLGGAAAASICEARAGKPFVSVDDFAMRARLSKKVVEILRAYGALDGMDDESQISLFDMMAP